MAVSDTTGSAASQLQSMASAGTELSNGAAKMSGKTKVMASNKLKSARARGSGPSPLLLAAGLLFLLLALGACGPVFQPKAFAKDTTGASKLLKKHYPLPQAALGGLGAVLLALALLSGKKGGAAKGKGGLPVGVSVNAKGELVDADGKPLARGLKADKKGRVLLPSGKPLPAAFALGAGGVLLHAGSGRPVPHSCSLNEEGVLVSSTGKALPDSMTIGPNSTLIAADGSVMSPDLEPVPDGFTLSPCGAYLLRPNGKPVPRGVHVGPGFRLLKPTGEALPDGVKIGPCGTIICVDDTVLGPDGAPLPSGYTLTSDKTQIITPAGAAVDEAYTMGPNGSVLDKAGKLYTAVGNVPLASEYTLGPLGNLLLRGHPVPSTAYWTAEGSLLGGDGSALNCAKASK